MLTVRRPVHSMTISMPQKARCRQRWTCIVCIELSSVNEVGNPRAPIRSPRGVSLSPQIIPGLDIAHRGLVRVPGRFRQLR